MDYSPIWISLKTAVASMLITFILGILLAFLVYSLKNKLLKNILDAFFNLPLVLPPTVLGFVLLMILGVNHPIGKFFLDVFNIRLTFSWVSTVIAAVVISLPLMYRTTLGAFSQVNRDLIYAARTLRMSEWTILKKVLLPNSLSGIMAGTVLAFARGLGEFGATAMIAGNIAKKTRTLSLSVYSDAVGGDYASATKYVLILLAISIGTIILLNMMSSYSLKNKEGADGN